MNTLVHVPIYEEVTELDPDEFEFVMEHRLPVATDHKRAFKMLWPVGPYARVCPECGAPDGKCSNTYCIRTRVTNKLFLYRW